ncbi:hypothetical protein O6H91_17G076000 [Diphasiastrum complanatum]|uniref:Uncharacterized protein n=1 Tax=Diphasiastrum complanatum TaxID=34168 RepID=A0ACC2B878_DIPCM|nr:hypothetical protein O6H91_17G076000 [Diphasiastrum complanatum]
MASALSPHQVAYHATNDISPPNRSSGGFHLVAVLVGATLAVIILLCFWRLLRHSNSPESNLPQQQAVENRIAPRQLGGLSKDFIQKLPLKKYSILRASRESKRFRDCPVCLIEFRDDDNIRILPKCGHGFHQDCIESWLSSHSSCPLCRQIAAPNSRIVRPSPRANSRERNTSSDEVTDGVGEWSSDQGGNEVFVVELRERDSAVVLNPASGEQNGATSSGKKKHIRRFASMETPRYISVKNWVDLVQYSTSFNNPEPSLEGQHLLQIPRPNFREPRFHSWHGSREAHSPS